MKKKVLAIMMVCLTLAFVGCGSTTSNNAAAEAPKVETAKTESVTKEEPKAPEKVEKTEEKTETKVEKKTEEKVEEATAEASVEVQEKVDETAAEAAPTESATTEKVEEAPAEPTYATVIEKYIADGDFFDYVAYGTEMGASNVTITNDEICIDFYFDGYEIGIRTNVQNTDEYGYVAIGTPDRNKTYACDVLLTGKPTVPVSSSGASVSIETLMLLEQTINYMKQNPNPNQIPNIPGMTWVVW